ncbi:hypothetical protein [Bradyrhizobium sp.]
MVKAQKTSAKRMGRPPKDKGDLRTERIALGAHPDLLRHLNDLARRVGIVRSVYIERILIGFVNELHGAEVLDAIGKEVRTAPPRADRLKGLRTPLSEDDPLLDTDVMPSTVPGLHPSRRFSKR